VSSVVSSATQKKILNFLKEGMYFSLYTKGGSTGGARNIFVRLEEKPSLRLTWRNAIGEEQPDSLELSTLTHIYGGKEHSEAFSMYLSATGSLPSPECLLTLVASEGRSLALEAPSWQARDAFVFGILTALKEAGTKEMPVWQPALGAQVPAGSKTWEAPRIVASEKPSVAAVAPSSPTAEQAARKASRAARLGGASGSLRKQPTSPRSPSAAAMDAAAESVNLSEVLQKLEKVFEQGKNFVRFTAGGHQPLWVHVWVVKNEAGNGFKVCWSKADDKTEHSSRTIKSEDVLGIALGKQAAVFKKEEAATAPSSHCFSLIAHDKSLHLQSWNQRDCDSWAFGLASLLKGYYAAAPKGVKPKLWEASLYTEQPGRIDAENNSELAESSAGASAISSSDIPRLANAAGFKCAVELSVKCRNLPSKHNNHIVCAFDKDPNSDKLTYIAQTEKQPRANNPEFRKTFRLTYLSSEQSRKLRLNVYDVPQGVKQMNEEDRMGSAVVGIPEVVDASTGIEFVFQLTHENPSKRNS
jgi:hypothetical protein